jgi:hypothetical protein
MWWRQWRQWRHTVMSLRCHEPSNWHHTWLSSNRATRAHEELWNLWRWSKNWDVILLVGSCWILGQMLKGEYWISGFNCRALLYWTVTTNCHNDRVQCPDTPWALSFLIQDATQNGCDSCDVWLSPFPGRTSCTGSVWKTCALRSTPALQFLGFCGFKQKVHPVSSGYQARLYNRIIWGDSCFSSWCWHLVIWVSVLKATWHLFVRPALKG